VLSTRFEVLVYVNARSAVWLNVISSNTLEARRRFGALYFHLEGKGANRAGYLALYLVQPVLLKGVFFDEEDGDMFFRNVGLVS
jgi:hypothetical protein